MKSFRLLLGILFLLSSAGCNHTEETPASSDDLYALFKNPPSEARPFVRWWWNGNCIEEDELQRELDVMKAAGIGGVEINPIAKPEGGDNFDYRCYEWLSPEWNERVKAAIHMAHERNMIVDMIMGAGWPFGGEFLEEEQFLQGVGIRKIELEGPRKYVLNLEEIWQLPGRNFGLYENKGAPDPKLFFLQMIPHGASGETGLVDLMDDVDGNGKIEIEVPKGRHDLYMGTFQKAYRTVMLGAPGSKGPVVNHYSAKDVRAYMNRLADALEAVLGGKLGDHIRALFCDSIELSGANITDDFFEEFLRRRGYDLGPFLPLVYYHPYEGYTDTLHYEQSFNDDIRRIRYDFNKTLVELFLERFPRTFDQWANEHGMQSRYQAYGMPWLMGILDGYRVVDIPESNNWLFSDNAKAHGYWIWNKYASSAAHLSGAKIVSSEAMTNTSGVFRTTLEMIKKNDDFNFISGINHSVLHGYSYSPPEAGFPGWVRFGAYFSDQNTWWPYFHHWANYNSRLSALFQHSKPVVDVAILTPEADIWKQWGLYRNPFYMNPWYNHDLWEGFSRVGVTADYINEGVIQRATAEKGNMKSEEARYQLVIVSGAKSMEPETARAIKDLAEMGVKFLFIDHLPTEAPSYFEKEKNDRMVRAYMEASGAFENVTLIDAPQDAATITSWADDVARDMGIEKGVSVSPVNENLYLTKYGSGELEIYFFSSQDDQNSVDFTVTFSDQKKTAWCWDPHTGERFTFPAGNRGELTIRLQPLESLLIVLDDNDQGEALDLTYPDENSFMSIGSAWTMGFVPVQGESFEMKSETLFEFGTHADKRISTFAGQVSYQTKFDLTGTDWEFLDLGIEKHVTEVTLNGYKLGVKWSGRHIYRIDGSILKEGENSLEITYTTTLANYANSLSNNVVAKRWINLQEPDPMGLTSGVGLMKSHPSGTMQQLFKGDSQ
ncbi:MAG: glycosyl hydrolase [Bacteroidota bacterium]